MWRHGSRAHIKTIAKLVVPLSTAVRIRAHSFPAGNQRFARVHSMSAIEDLYTTRREVRRKRPAVRALRKEIYAEQNGLCVYCQKPTLLPEDAPTPGSRVATLEHRTPLARGGTNERDNLAVACNPCNHAKGDLTEAEFIANGMRGRPPGMTRALAAAQAKRRRREHRNLPPLDHRKSLTSILLELELDIRTAVFSLGAERYIGGFRRSRKDTKAFESVALVMEHQIEREVKRVADLRYPQIWGRDRLPKARFDKTGAFTCSLGEMFNTSAQAERGSECGSGCPPSPSPS